MAFLIHQKRKKGISLMAYNSTRQTFNLEHLMVLFMNIIVLVTDPQNLHKKGIDATVSYNSSIHFPVNLLEIRPTVDSKF